MPAVRWHARSGADATVIFEDSLRGPTGVDGRVEVPEIAVAEERDADDVAVDGRR